MSESAFRTWTDPGWGKQLYVLEHCKPFWIRSEWYGHLGTQTLVYGILLLSYPMLDLMLDLMFGNIGLSDASVRLQENGPGALAICLGGGALMALLIRFLESRGVKLDDSLPQAEIFNNGLYLSTYGYVKGMHPFFPWSHVTRIDKKRKHGRIDLTLHLLHLAKPSKLSLDVITAAEVAAIPELRSQPDNPLSKALSDLLANQLDGAR